MAPTENVECSVIGLYKKKDVISRIWMLEEILKNLYGCLRNDQRHLIQFAGARVEAFSRSGLLFMLPLESTLRSFFPLISDNMFE